MKRSRGLLLCACLLVSLICVAYPVYVIRPFRAQGVGELAAALLISPVLLLSKSRKHFVTLGYVDGDGKQQVMVIRVEKGDIRSVLAGLEARTGRRIEFQDEEARKAIKE